MLAGVRVAQPRTRVGQQVGAGTIGLATGARARLNDPNAGEYEKLAARAVLRFRQRDGRDGVTAQETEGDVRFRFTGSREDFDKMRDEAVKRNGLVMPGLADKQVRIVAGDSKIPFDVSLRDTVLKNQVKSYAREHADEILGDVEVEGGIVNVSLTSIGEMADPKSYKNTLKNGISKEIHFAVIPKIKEIIGNSIDAEVHPDYLDRDASGMRIAGRYSDHILMHRLYGAVEIDGQVYRVKTTVKEDKTNNTNRTHTYEVAEIELLKSHTRPADSTSPISNNSISGANLLQDVRKSYDSGKLLLDESAKTTESGGISQGFGSAATSLNQVASAMRKIDWKPGTVNVDIGGGRFDKATEYLREQGVESMVFDPFNRDAEHNRQVAERVRDEKVDTVTCNNVLNVIDSASSRANVILQAAKALKPGGTAYFSVYEGDKSGVGRQTKSDSWQNNRVTKDYVSEIERYFDDVTVKDKVIIAKNPKATTEQSVWDFDGTYSGNDVRFRLRNYDKESEKISEAGRKGLNLQEPNQTRYGRETERDSVERRSVGDRLREESAGAASGSGDRGDLERLSEGLATEQYGDNVGGSRTQQEEAGNHIIGNAKAHGLFIPLNETRGYGERKRKPTGESTVYINESEGRVYKVKDPFAKYPMKRHAMSDVLYEHELHNLLFPNIAYRLEGVSEDIGEVRLVFSQDYLRDGFEPATQKQIDKLKEIGVTDEQLKEVDIADNLEGLTRSEAREILVLADPRRNQGASRGRAKVSRQSQGVLGAASDKEVESAAGNGVNFRVRDGRHGSAGIEEPHGEHSGHEGAVEEARRRHSWWRW